jgi:hypothetical protein
MVGDTRLSIPYSISLLLLVFRERGNQLPTAGTRAPPYPVDKCSCHRKFSGIKLILHLLLETEREFSGGIIPQDSPYSILSKQLIANTRDLTKTHPEK